MRKIKNNETQNKTEAGEMDLKKKDRNHKHVWKFDYEVFEGTFYICSVDGCSVKGKLTAKETAIRKYSR